MRGRSTLQFITGHRREGTSPLTFIRWSGRATTASVLRTMRTMGKSRDKVNQKKVEGEKVIASPVGLSEAITQGTEAIQDLPPSHLPVRLDREGRLAFPAGIPLAYLTERGLWIAYERHLGEHSLQKNFTGPWHPD